jgi:hypothetical protein
VGYLSGFSCQTLDGGKFCVFSGSQLSLIIEQNQAIALCESKTLRESKLGGLSQDRALEMLDKAKSLVVALHQGVGIATTEQVAEYFEVSIETIQTIIKTNRIELESDGLRLAKGKELKDVLLVINKSDKIPTLIVWTPRAMLRCGMLLRDSAVAKQVRNVLLDIAEQKVLIEKLEEQFIPVASLKTIDEAATILGKRFGSAYEQRFLSLNISKHHKNLGLPSFEREELASLPTAKALLTPTQIAEELGWKCKSVKAKGFDAIGINKKLAELGYQERIGGKWSATQKAIDLNLCDRKPVDTNSRTQQDQLLWSVDVLPILQEYSIV